MEGCGVVWIFLQSMGQFHSGRSAIQGQILSPLQEEITNLGALALAVTAKSGRGPQPGLRVLGKQPFPGGLVVRIRRSHRRGPGSIPGQGMPF